MDEVLSAISVVDGPADDCCGTERCQHTVIQHGNQTGWLVGGKLRCRSHVEDPLVECALDLGAVNCELVSLLDGHTHGPDCGHELVPHGDHYDYLVGGNLHHVVSTAGCCERHCLDFLEPGSIVRHGRVDVVRDGPNSHFPYLGLKEQETVEDEGRDDVDGFVTTYIFAAGVCCPIEVRIIDRILKPLPGVESADTMIITKTVKVVHDASKVSPSALVAALNDAKLQASLGEKGGKTGPQRVPFPWHVIASGILLVVSLLSLIDNDLEHAKWLALGSVAFGIPGVLRRAIRSVRNFMLDINVLMVIAVAGAIGIDEYHEAGAIVFLFGAAAWLETKCMGRARDAVNSLLEIQPDTAMSAETRKLISIDKVQIDDHLIVRPGDRVPVDSIVVEGSSTLDESMLTGETRPVPKVPNDTVTSGTINCGHASLHIKATATANDSTVAALAKLVEQASLQKSQTARLVEQFSTIYTPVVTALAAGLVFVPLAVGVDNIDDWIYLALVLLVTACPCALVISTPVTTVCGISRAAKQGILIKGGQYLEALARLKAITFDKTGTLTEGRFGVIAVEAFEGHSKEDVLQWSAAVELHSTHPVGPTIVGCAAARGVAVRSTAIGVETIPGMGICGVVDGRSVRVGNMMLMQKAAPEYDFFKLQTLEDMYLPQGASICYVCVENSVLGAILVSDCVRGDARQAINKLQRRHLTVGMLTGDRCSAARVVAEQLNIQAMHTHAELLPEEKLTKVAEYRSTYGAEAHVGDGINDTLALARADVGIAMGIAGSAMAVEAADVALFTNDLLNLVLAIDIGRRVRWKIIQNIVFSITIKVVVIILASMGHIMLWIAVIADVGSAMLVVMNGLTLLTYQSGNAARIESSGCVQDKTQSTWKKFLGFVQKGQALMRASDSALRTLLTISPQSPQLQGFCQSAAYASLSDGSHNRNGSDLAGTLGQSGFDGLVGPSHRKAGSRGGHLLGQDRSQEDNTCKSGCCSKKPATVTACSKSCRGTKTNAESSGASPTGCKSGGGCCGNRDQSHGESTCQSGCCGKEPDTVPACSKVCCGTRADAKSSGASPTGCKADKGCTGNKDQSHGESTCQSGCCGKKPDTVPACSKGCCGTKADAKSSGGSPTDCKAGSGCSGNKDQSHGESTCQSGCCSKKPDTVPVCSKALLGGKSGERSVCRKRCCGGS